jgi:hypothetical protein
MELSGLLIITSVRWLTNAGSDCDMFSWLSTRSHNTMRYSLSHRWPANQEPPKPATEVSFTTICSTGCVKTQLRSRRSGASRILRKSKLILHMISYIYLYKGDQVKSRLHHTGIWSAAAWPPRHLCYRPAVFFCHLRLIASHSREEEFCARLKKCYSILLHF